MIHDFERQLAIVLSGRLAPPLRGRVDAAPGSEFEPDDVARLSVGVVGATPLDQDVWTRKAEVTPGSATARRVVKLRCDVRIDVRARAGTSRAARVEALNAAIYELDHDEFRNGRALLPQAPGADPGFVIQRLEVAGVSSPRTIEEAGAAGFGVSLIAEGQFWPVGVTGAEGVAIGEIQLRGVRMPLMLIGAPGRFAAGSGATDLQVQIGVTGRSLLRGERVPAATSAFGSLAIAAFAPGRRPPAGRVGGGAAGAGGVRLLEVVQDAASFTYAPPAVEAVDELIVGFADATGGMGPEIGRFSLSTRAS